MKYSTTIIGLIAILWLAGCGQKGDLYQSTNAPPPELEKTEMEKTAR